MILEQLYPYLNSNWKQIMDENIKTDDRLNILLTEIEKSIRLNGNSIFPAEEVISLYESIIRDVINDPCMDVIGKKVYISKYKGLIDHIKKS